MGTLISNPTDAPNPTHLASRVSNELNAAAAADTAPAFSTRAPSASVGAWRVMPSVCKHQGLNPQQHGSMSCPCHVLIRRGWSWVWRFLRFFKLFCRDRKSKADSHACTTSTEDHQLIPVLKSVQWAGCQTLHHL